MTAVTSDRSLEQRIAYLERIESIKAVKYRYWRACDAKDPAAFRDCFVKNGASIDYGSLGSFNDADGITAVFTEIALRKVEGRYAVLDMHHGFHPDITVLDGTQAIGTWSLRIRQVNLQDRSELLATGEYDDAYVVEDGQWKIAKSRFRQLWSIRRPLPVDAMVEQVRWADAAR